MDIFTLLLAGQPEEERTLLRILRRNTSHEFNVNIFHVSNSRVSGVHGPLRKETWRRRNREGMCPKLREVSACAPNTGDQGHC